jgi:type I restriction enzyme M protein
LQESGTNAFYDFVNTNLIPRLKKLKDHPRSTSRQKVISEIMSGVDRTRIDTERNLCDVLDKVHDISPEHIDPTHVFTLADLRGLAAKMGEKATTAGSFSPARDHPHHGRGGGSQAGETVHDPAAARAVSWPRPANTCWPGWATKPPANNSNRSSAAPLRPGEGEPRYPIALANLILHGIDEPHLWHGNSLTRAETYGGLYENAPATFDVVLTNPPFGGKEGEDAQNRFNFKTRATQVFLRM